MIKGEEIYKSNYNMPYKYAYFHRIEIMPEPAYYNNNNKHRCMERYK